MVEAIAMGRKIYNNLKKAIQYIISIHVPIILTVFLPLALNWKFPHIFSPVHVIFFELIMGPTCSIVYENEPLEKDSMKQCPRKMTTNFLQWKEISISIVQGLIISVGTLGIYQYAVSSGLDESVTRAMVFTTLVVANIFLTLVNRSFYYSIITAATYKNNLLWWVLAVTLILLSALLFVPALSTFFQFRVLTAAQLGIATLAGFMSVIWFELYKWMQRKRGADTLTTTSSQTLP
jgi:Ca2+-transporting ATPase